MIDFADIFLTDFAQVGFGFLDQEPLALVQDPRLSRQRRDPGRGDLQRRPFRQVPPSAAPSAGGRPAGDHHGLALQPLQGPGPRLPPPDGRLPRRPLPQRVTDFANPDPDTNAKRMINRWRLEKANPAAKLSPPKKQIVWYIEDNVPEEYRPYVQEGILEWNKAFEKIGFKDAIAVRWQNERDDFEPEDINYCTLRWITTGRTFAMSGLRSNPLTGEMIDGDVIFDASWIKRWKEEYAFLVGMPIPTGPGPATDQAARHGPPGGGRDHQPDHGREAGIRLSSCLRPAAAAPPRGTRPCWAGAADGSAAGREGNSRWPSTSSPPAGTRSRPISAAALSQGRMASCNYAAAKSHEMRFAALALALAATPTGPDKDKPKNKDPRRTRTDEGQGEGKEDRSSSSPRSSWARRSRKW